MAAFPLRVLHPMSILGSVAERQDFFMTGAKPLYRFRDRALAGLMAARGWLGEWPLCPWPLHVSDAATSGFVKDILMIGAPGSKNQNSPLDHAINDGDL